MFYERKNVCHRKFALGIAGIRGLSFPYILPFPKRGGLGLAFFGFGLGAMLVSLGERPVRTMALAFLFMAVLTGATIVFNVSFRHWGEWGPALVIAIIFAYFLAWLFLGFLAWDIRRIVRKSKEP